MYLENSQIIPDTNIIPVPIHTAQPPKYSTPTQIDDNHQQSVQPIRPTQQSTTIPIKLDGTSHFLWRNVLESLLDAYNLIGYAEGTFPHCHRLSPPRMETKKSLLLTQNTEDWEITINFVQHVFMLMLGQKLGSSLFRSPTSWAPLFCLAGCEQLPPNGLLDSSPNNIQAFLFFVNYIYYKSSHIASYCAYLLQNFQLLQAHLVHSSNLDTCNLDWYINFSATHHATTIS